MFGGLTKVENGGLEACSPRTAQDRTWAVIDALRKVTERQGRTMAQVSLSWVAARPVVTSVLLGARKRTRLADNLGSAELQPSAEDMDLLSAASAPLHDVYPYGAQADQQRHRKISGGR